MKFSNHKKTRAKTICLSIGVLALSLAVSYISFVVAKPDFSPPKTEKISEFINVGSVAQIKEGFLSVSNLFTSEIFLNTDADDEHREGSINRIDELKGDDGMYLGANEFNDAEIYLDKTNQALVFSNNQSESLKINNSGVYISELEDCVLFTDADGKIGCYSSEPPGTGYGGEVGLLSINITDSTDNPPVVSPAEEFCKIGSGESCVTDDEVVAKITMGLLSIEKNTDGSCNEADLPGHEPYVKSHFYIKESGSSVWDLKQSLSLLVFCERIAFDYCICYSGEKSGTWYYHLKRGDEIKITAQVYEHMSFEPLANLRSKISITALKDIRPDPAQGFAYSDAEILYYYDPNTTGLMSIYDTPEPVTGQYLFPIQQSTVFAVDGFPIFIDN